MPPTQDKSREEEKISRPPAAQSGIYVPPSIDPGDTPERGDVDPGATKSADETGQGGDVWEAKKKKAMPWNG